MGLMTKQKTIESIKKGLGGQSTLLMLLERGLVPYGAEWFAEMLFFWSGPARLVRKIENE